MSVLVLIGSSSSANPNGRSRMGIARSEESISAIILSLRKCFLKLLKSDPFRTTVSISFLSKDSN